MFDAAAGGGSAPDENQEHPVGEPAADGVMPVELPKASPAELQRLDVARTLLLKVHRALLEAERVRYEKARGRIENNSAFLQLVINDPWFDWLRPMAQMVLLIDERTSDKKSPLGSDEARALLDRAKALLKADPEGDAFQRLFADALQHSPALAVIARQVAAVLHG
ncbi:hypothetical protein [Gemmatimonas sp.]|uniref:hypothetical protein n=1 Tax=Gemmatimonas sp. TaxID=1962908 RepID=UPI0033429901